MLFPSDTAYMYARESRFRDKKVLLAVWCTHDALYECSAGTYRADEEVKI